MGYFYTAVFNKKSREIQFAEHFEDEKEMRKRAIQLEAHARSFGEYDPWLCYSGSEPVESYFAELDGKDKKDIKTKSVLTPPETDDSKEARPLPPWAIAQHAMEKAMQAVADAKQGADALQLRADNLADEAYSKDSKSMTEGLKLEVRRKALSAQGDADYEKARLYHAEQDLADKVEKFNAFFSTEQDRAKSIAEEAHKK